MKKIICLFCLCATANASDAKLESMIVANAAGIKPGVELVMTKTESIFMSSSLAQSGDIIQLGYKFNLFSNNIGYHVSFRSGTGVTSKSALVIYNPITEKINSYIGIGSQSSWQDMIESGIIFKF